MKHYDTIKHFNTMTQHVKTTFHPVHACNSGKFNTASGKIIDLKNPSEDSICIDDIANALSKICRFGGNTNQFYSVAQHSVLVSKLVDPEFAKEALLHDASEAYLGDVIKPLKVMIGNAYDLLEKNFETVIAHRFNLRQTPQIKAAIKVADMHALEIEHEAFQKGNFKPIILALAANGLHGGHLTWGCNEAKHIFKAHFSLLFTPEWDKK
jgi:hypothetical protein